MCVFERRVYQLQPDYLMVESRGYNREIAYHHIIGKKPTLVWLGGYRSDMMGTKAEAIDQWARTNNYGSLRLEYSGHGQSGGEFTKGTISLWLEESLAVFDALKIKKAILVGSSMGGWIALRMAQELYKQKQSERLHGMLLLAPAPDFTHELMMPHLSDEHKHQLETKGYMEEASEYSDEPNIFTKALFDDGMKNPVEIAEAELDQLKTPLIIRREVSRGVYEYWRINEFVVKKK